MPILARGDYKTWVEAAVVVGAALVLYFFTAARDIVVGDTPELITAAVTLGIPHPPGYPLFAMLGHLFSLLPVGEPAWRVNWMSAVFGALASALLAIAFGRLSGSPRAGLAAALLWAFAVTPWRLVNATEVFA